MRNQKTLELMAEGKFAPIDPDEWRYDCEFECPNCSGSHFGSSGGFAHCHDEFNDGCRWSGKRSECFVLTKAGLAQLLLEKMIPSPNGANFVEKDTYEDL